MNNIKEWSAIKNGIRDSLRDYIYKETKRSPMILPVIMEV
jgi:ribonuclease J